MHNFDRKSYSKLCKTCDEILLSDKANTAVIANSWLNIIKEHPDFLKKYDVLLHNISKHILFGRYLKTVGHFLIIFFGQILRSFKNTGYWTSSQELKQSDCLFISHLINKNTLKQSSDSYFYDLPTQLLKQGLSVKTALIDHVGLSSLERDIFSRNCYDERVILNSSLSFSEEVKLYLSQFKAITCLKKIFRNTDASHTFKKNTFVYSFAPDTLSSLRAARQVSKLIAIVKPKYLIVTYEGYAWERLMFNEARKYNSKVKCIGYQHAAILQYQHSIRRDISKSYNPDIILTAGMISEKILKKTDSVSRTSVICFGSGKLKDMGFQKKNDLSVCLVVPEGIVSECLLLFKFSLLCAKSMTNQQFIWRLHPSFSFNLLKKYSDIFNELPSNIILSQGSVESDIKQCDSVLYRGSTTVINAINYGLKPIFYQDNDMLSIDPIFQINTGKFIVNSVEEVKRAVANKASLKNKIDLKKFSNNFYSPFNYTVLDKILR